mgnify:CR=1 FL=1
MRYLASAFLTATTLLSPVAIAEKAAILPDLSGTWSITTLDDPCEFGGQATLTKSDTGYVGQLIMRHDCPNWESGPITALQSSTISISGNQVSVRSKIIDFPLTSWSSTYAPDHFALTIQSADRMHGIQTDRYGMKSATWVRSESGIS